MGTTTPMIPVGWGELLDKVSILEIKIERIESEAKQHAEREMAVLRPYAAEVLPMVQAMYDELLRINKRLWDVEDAIRLEERRATFGLTFIELARSVYFFNDQRASIKRAINIALDSEIVEVKSYV